MSKIRFYIIGIFSIIAMVFYSLPWTYGATHSSLGFYVFSYIWFMGAWLFLLMHIVFLIVAILEKNSNWKHHLAASGLIVLSYIGVVIMFSRGWQVTV